MKKKLTNPFVLGLQGFVAGAILFWSSNALNPDVPMPPTQTAAGSNLISRL
jgi:hypothetical protein